MSQSPRLSDKAVKEIEANFANEQEAFHLLALIDAEFRSDPMSVQCFDLRIVERVRLCVASRADFERMHPFGI